MSAVPTILVAGATGKVGRELVKLLLDRGQAVRALTRHPETARLPGGVEVVRGDLDDAEAIERALAGIDRMFFMGPDTSLPAQAANLARAARSSPLRHVVMLSSLAAEMTDSNPLALEHREAERIIEASGFDWTLLRGGAFSSNTLGWAQAIRNEATVRCVLRNIPYAPIDPYDIACVAAEALTATGHIGQTYALTGEESITPEQQTQVLATLLSRPLRFVELSDDEARAAFRRVYANQAEADGKLRALRSPEAPWNFPRPDTRRITGQRSRTYQEWAQRNIDAFR
ncbi:MAG TPA: NAD(P)H-binding protein [Steroidobacter sp.]|uniref:NAD(P)H-binding protein n=1 Tax=Steroidobacter sp. TaxID=1978227 RepID=UPI002ED98E72